jgi:hypothetical protein
MHLTGFETPRGGEFVAPGEAQLRDGLLVDLAQRGVAMIVLSSAVHRPVAGLDRLFNAGSAERRNSARQLVRSLRCASCMPGVTFRSFRWITVAWLLSLRRV